MVEYTRTTLARHLAKALLYSSVVIGVVSLGVGLLLDADAAIGVWVGAAIVGLPQVWLAASLFSRFGAHAPTLLGIAKFSLSALLFGVWFSKSPNPQAGPVFFGAVLLLVCSPVFYFWVAKQKS
ncbi:hypothetical protein N9393_00095 [Luminiphilus sp.]|nr:hypothetical protein [Luminiphilus sp.]